MPDAKIYINGGLKINRIKSMLINSRDRTMYLVDKLGYFVSGEVEKNQTIVISGAPRSGTT